MKSKPSPQSKVSTTDDPKSSLLDGIERSETVIFEHLAVAILVNRLFTEYGWDMVVVGGTALGFYTHWNYAPTNLDLCRRQQRPIPPNIQVAVMQRLGGIRLRGLHQWKVLGVIVNIHGVVETDYRHCLREAHSLGGRVQVIPVEQLLVERFRLATMPSVGTIETRSVNVARQLLASCLDGTTVVDWAMAEAIAGSEAYGILEPFRAWWESGGESMPAAVARPMSE